MPVDTSLGKASHGGGGKEKSMKKFLVAALTVAMCLSLATCGEAKTPDGEQNQEQNQNNDQSPAGDEKADAKSEGVMTYAEYAAAEIESQVVVETYVQAKQSWWDGKLTVYSQDKDGAYFIYNMSCESQEEADKLVPGTKIKVTGYKAEWSGEIEIVDATYEIMEGSYVAAPVDVTELLGTDELAQKQNLLVSFKGMTVESAAKYKWDGSGSQGDDLYFDVSVGGNTYSFTVESYLCGADTEVYKAVEALQVGDVVDMEGFLYWYEGPNPHITAVTVK